MRVGRDLLEIAARSALVRDVPCLDSRPLVPVGRVNLFRAWRVQLLVLRGKEKNSMLRARTPTQAYAAAATAAAAAARKRRIDEWGTLVERALALGLVPTGPGGPSGNVG